MLSAGGEGSLGLVLSMTDHKASWSWRSWCKVTWNAGHTNDYKVGHEGRLDVLMIDGASGGCYYPEHLAPLGHPASLPPTGEQCANKQSDDGLAIYCASRVQHTRRYMIASLFVCLHMLQVLSTKLWTDFRVKLRGIEQ